MSKNLSAKYFQENKYRLQRKSSWKILNFSKEEKRKSNNIVVNVTKISEDEKQELVEYRKKYYRMRKKFLLIFIKNICFKE